MYIVLETLFYTLVNSYILIVFYIFVVAGLYFISTLIFNKMYLSQFLFVFNRIVLSDSLSTCVIYIILYLQPYLLENTCKLEV